MQKEKSLEGVLELLDQLQATVSRDVTSMKHRQEQTKRMMAAIVEAVPPADIARRLGVNQFTVARWSNGDNAPRKIQLDQLRRLVQVELGPARAKYTAAPFEGHFIGVYPAVDYFFERVADADGNHLYVSEAYVFKSLLGFHAADEPETIVHLANLLTDNTSLRVHYVYPLEFDGSETKAHATYREMVENEALKNVIGQLISHPISNVEAFAALGLGYTYCGYFVLIYNELGKKQYGGRDLDILVEIPCQAYTNNGISGNPLQELHYPDYLFVELPQKDLDKLWAKWMGALARVESVKDNSNPGNQQ